MTDSNKQAAEKLGFRRSINALHTWSGLLLGWILYFVFVTGTAGYFDTEIDRWMQPELPVQQKDPDLADIAQALVPVLQQRAPNADEWTIAFPVDRNRAYPQIYWEGADTEKDGVSANGNLANMSLQTGEAFQTRDTHGGQLLYKMHYNLHYLPRLPGLWLVGIASMFMFVAIITGVIIHKRIFVDFFTFRRKRGPRSWMDAHNVLSVIALPFHLMITYSGLIFVGSIYMPLLISAFYDGGLNARAAFGQDLFPPTQYSQALNEAKPLADLSPMLAFADNYWGKNRTRYMEIHHPGDANARVVLKENIDDSVVDSAQSIIFDGVSGEVLEFEGSVRDSTTTRTASFFTSLHEGIFAGPMLRWLYFISGLLGTAMIATGLMLWSVKRQKQAKRRGLGHLLVEKLNIGTVIGLPVGVAAYFWANRLLPLEMPARADWEVHSLFLVWLLMLCHAALRPSAAAWKEQLFIAIAAFALLPVINALTTDRHLLNSLVQGDWVIAGFDLTMLLMAACFALALFIYQRHQDKQPAFKARMTA